MTLEELAGRYWLTYSEYNPTVATVRGEHEFDDQLRRYDDDWLGEMASAFGAITEQALAFDARSLSTQERISLDLLIHESRVWATEISARYLVGPIDPYLGPHTRLLSDTRQNTVTTVEQADALLGRYSKVPRFLRDALRFHLANAAAGMTPALASVERVIGQLDGYLDSELDDDPFLQLEVPGGGEGWRERATTVVTEQIRPAFERYRDGLVSDITPLARPDDRCGLTWIDGGEEIYSTLIHKYTQLDTSPGAIHDIGLHWATEVNAAEWVEIGGAALGVETMEQVLDRLHNDPAMRFDSEEEMLEQARDAVARAWEAVDDWFGAKPQTPCRVVPVPRSQAPAMPPAYYMQPPIDGSRPGTYFLNTYQPEERDRFEYESIHFHEAVPGH
ncbi:MAG: DUF885 domain-containing protein, partial [Actinobacteria bacterium]|nr:DUF885 domain-containing protein [Actinomycetota bacterium]